MQSHLAFMKEHLGKSSPVELATLVSVVADQHLIVRAPESLLEEAQSEFEQVATETFGFTHAVLQCSAHTTLEEFVDAVLVGEKQVLDSRKVANLVIAVNLDLTDRNVQIQALEVTL